MSWWITRKPSSILLPLICSAVRPTSWMPPSSSNNSSECRFGADSRRIDQLNTELSRERSRHKAACRLGNFGRIVANDSAVNMRHLERRIALLEQSKLELIECMPELSEKLTLLSSTTGIARKTGPHILAELAALPADMTGPQRVAHAGLDPRPYESGSSTH